MAIKAPQKPGDEARPVCTRSAPLPCLTSVGFTVRLFRFSRLAFIFTGTYASLNSF